MRIGKDLLWFLWCGARERLARIGAFGVAGASVTFYCDVIGTGKGRAWLTGSGFAGFAGLFLFAILLAGRKHRPLTVMEGATPPRRATRTQPALPTSLHIYRDLALFGIISAVQLFGAGFGQALLGDRANSSDPRSVSVFAALIPELQRLRLEVAGVKRETSDDPRKELANLGVSWSAENFLRAVQEGDERLVRLFLDGGMRAETEGSTGKPLPVALALNQVNPGEILDLLAGAGLDVNRGFTLHGVAGAQETTLLGRAIEKGNRSLVEALIHHRADLNRRIVTFGMMGLPRETYPLASAIHWEQFEIAGLMLDAGADVGTGDYAAYREVNDLLAGPKAAANRAALASLRERTAPPPAARGQLDSQSRLDEIQRELSQVAMESLRSPPGSPQKRQLDQKYEALQRERARLRATASGTNR